MCRVWFNYYEIKLYTTSSKSGGKGKGNTQTHNGTNIFMNLIVQTDINLGIETTNSTGLGFSRIRIQSEL